jgi:hypothetical protein
LGLPVFAANFAGSSARNSFGGAAFVVAHDAALDWVDVARGAATAVSVSAFGGACVGGIGAGVAGDAHPANPISKNTQITNRRITLS